MRDTIRHDNTGRSIAAYLSAVASVRSRQEIGAYMRLMHDASHDSVDSSIRFLIRRRTIVRVRRGSYRATWEIV